MFRNPGGFEGWFIGGEGGGMINTSRLRIYESLNVLPRKFFVRGRVLERIKCQPRTRKKDENFVTELAACWQNSGR